MNAKSSTRFCVFCGRPPTAKNKEHVLPQWLLRMTGDPARVVSFGTNFAKGQEVRFSWSGLVMPACTDCNQRYSALEETAKGIVEALAERSGIEAGDYLVLLDWLDKVRVGLWLAYHVLQGNPTNIQPTFQIDARIGTKDRMLAVYPMETENTGLNAFGVESFVFHRAPSCFALRVNNLLLVNASADFLAAGRCGFPFPRTMQLLLDGPDAGMLALNNFDTRRRIRRPVLRIKLHKPSVLLFQPIMMRTADPSQGNGFVGNFADFDSFLAEHTLPPYLSGRGVLIREYPHRAECISDMEQAIEFDSVSGHECQPMYALVAQVYELQNYIQSLYKPVASEASRLEAYLAASKLFSRWNTRAGNYLRKQAVSQTSAKRSPSQT